MNGWKWATFGLAGLVVLQFFWWNKKAPHVLNLGQRFPRLGGGNGGTGSASDSLRELGADARWGNNWLTQ